MTEIELYVIINPKYTDSNGEPKVTVRTTPSAFNNEVPGWKQVPVRLTPKAVRALARKLKGYPKT